MLTFVTMNFRQMSLDNLKELTRIESKQYRTYTETLRHATFQFELIEEYVIDQYLPVTTCF